MEREKLTDLEFVLLTMLGQLGPTHPYRLGREVETRAGGSVVSLGAMYKAVHRLEKHELVKSHWEDVDPVEAKRPRRRVYEITGLGERVAKQTSEQRAALLRPALGMRGAS